ncbi:hypothetical protein M8J77_013682 [Diaphorina citri]|nr:hypothetical protein M8J77_013682 [Diaphorina citri]
MTDSMICWILLGVLACVSCQEPEPEPGYITIFEGYFANNGSKNDIGTGHFKWNFRSKTTAEDEKNTTISREADNLHLHPPVCAMHGGVSFHPEKLQIFKTNADFAKH